ncbi:hypothetical protein KJ742_07250 [Patescibacteria group bacterium]|nr:hypothetical protein [Patescibacteria group bacterium]MBU1683708.1 hypothetical protein [Patescibacteria group bacterium]MBU1935255.1 hypothetical protein [Patescibacteria group bacterium]
MKKQHRLVYWLPRVLTIIYIVFISLFALDTLGEENFFIPLLIHLIPSFVLIAVLWMSWKKEVIGGIMFLAFAIFYLTISWGKADPFAYLVMIGPLLLISFLFFGNYIIKK